MPRVPKIKVVGVGGSGVNAVSRMVKEGVAGVELIAVNTDIQSLKTCLVATKILLGEKTTGGFGAGMDLKLGEKAVRESQEALKQALNGAEMVFLTCGLGGGTGTSAIPVLGEIAKSLGALTIAVATLPFSFEGVWRKNVALQGLDNLKDRVDSLLVIPNDKILGLSSPNTTVNQSFWLCDGVLREAVKGISDLISLPGIINVDLADLRGILENSGEAFLGIGRAKGEKRALAAAEMALHSSLLDFSLKEARGVLLNIAGKEDLSLTEVSNAASFIKEHFPPNIKIVFGVSEDNSLSTGEVKITVVATNNKK